MKRREFISILGSAAAWAGAWPTLAFAQQTPRPRIGLIPLGSPNSTNDWALVDALFRGLRDLGLINSLNIDVDVAWVKEEVGFAQPIKELIDRGATILIPAGTSASVAAKKLTATLPIIFVTVGDPVGVGLVNSLDRPGGNVTGFSDVLLDLSGKYVGLAQDVSGPGTNAVDYLWYSDWANGRQRFEATQQAASKVGVQLRSHTLRDAGSIDEMIAVLKKSGTSVTIVQPSPFTYRLRPEIIAAGARHGVGTIFGWPDAAREGALIGYGPDYQDIYRRAASYVERVLRGAKPSELPVQQPDRFQLVLNSKTAGAIGITLLPNLIISADEVIE